MLPHDYPYGDRHSQQPDPLGLDFIEDKERLAFDLLEVRNIIEPAIAALAARHATPEAIAEMESLYNLMEYHILHGQDYLDEDMKFHRTIARASGNPMPCSTSASAHMDTPPIPARWTRLPGCNSVRMSAAGCIIEKTSKRRGAPESVV